MSEDRRGGPRDQHARLFSREPGRNNSQARRSRPRKVHRRRRKLSKKPRGYGASGRCRPRPRRSYKRTEFKYDHSEGYRDFQPFYARVGDSWTLIDYSKQADEWMKPLQHGKEIDLVDIAANWYVDDLPPMMFIKKSPNSHGFVNPRDIEDLSAQFDWVYREMDYATFCFTIIRTTPLYPRAGPTISAETRWGCLSRDRSPRDQFGHTLRPASGTANRRTRRWTRT